jgi:tetratricopeptide (TPR) repeat protein
MGGRKVSRKQAFLAAMTVMCLVTTGCATGHKPVSELDRLKAQAAYERAITHMQAREGSAALTAAQEAVGFDGNLALYRDLLGLVYLELQRPDLAIPHFQRAVEIDPKFADAYFHLGTALAENRRWEEAVATYRTALALPTITVPDFAHQNLGVALYNLHRYREAEQALRLAISLDPKLQAAYYHLGLLFSAEQRAEEAKAAFRHARQLAPESPFGQAASAHLKALGEGG